MMVMLSKQSPDMFDKVKRLENAFNETIGALPKDAQELANKVKQIEVQNKIEIVPEERYTRNLFRRKRFRVRRTSTDF